MRKEDFFTSLENIDESFIEEAEQYKGSKLNNPVFMYIGMAASLLVVAGVALMFLLMNREDATVETNVETAIPTEVIINGTGLTEVSKEIFNARDDRIKMLQPLDAEIPDGSVVVFLHPSGSVYLNGMEGWYAPDEQDVWKSVILDAVSHAKDKQYDTFPHGDMMSIHFVWKHDGVEEYWQLANDGSLWGSSSPENGSGNDMFTKNYIAPEDAARVAALMKQLYDFFGMDPIKPDEIGEITYAELTVKGKTYTLDDKVKLSYLGTTLKKGELTTPSGCPWATLKLSRSDGTTISLSLAWDGCAIWHSDGKHYRYGDYKAAESIFQLFGIDMQHILDSN
ncbi:MAG: hypothetical protein IKT10_03185 [Clostridiales bacterium]|nr:hypothetical protein [Clostridiales bacterium]